MDSQNTNFPSLPEQIIQEEILPRLPVKSLMRFRCVSKPWRSLIGNKRFQKIHHQNSIQNPSQQRVILQNKGNPPKQCSLQSLLLERPTDLSPLDATSNNISLKSFKVLGCYNGLVCIHQNPGEFYLWNPSTRISKKLPKFADGRCYVETLGFGWVESSDEYKVFALMRERDTHSNGGKVYSSKSKSWKTIEYFRDLFLCWAMVGVFAAGKLHWKIAIDKNLIFFDLKSEAFGRIELPFHAEDGPLFIDEWYGEIGGCLCMLYHNVGRKVRVWVMKEYGVKESWERLVELSLDHELLQRPLSASFAVGSNGEILVFQGSTFLVYDPKEENVFRFPEIFSRYASRHVYVESLLSPEDA